MPNPPAEIVPRPTPAIQPASDHLNRAAALVLDAVGSDNTRRAYRRALLGGSGDTLGFLPWLALRGQAMDKAAVNAYRRYLEAAGLAASSINQTLAAVRKLATEAADAGWMSDATAQAVRTAPGVRVTGTRTGNWLTKQQARDLLDAPDASKLSGLRDRALLAMLVGCALRRDEVARLMVADVQQRDGRWVIVDLAGKHGRIRTVPMPSWTKVAIDAWTGAARILDGPLLRPVHKSGEVMAGPMTSQAIYARVLRHAEQLGLEIAPHDLRRTFAQLARKGGAPIEQIQISLGHASIATTERYLGGRLDLADAACDRLGIG